MAFTIPSLSASSGGTYEPIAPDQYPGICIGVIDLGCHDESFQGQPAKRVHKVKLLFEIPDELRADGQTYLVTKTFNVSMHEKANFRKTLEGWLGPEETGKLVSQSMEALIFKPALINMVQAPARDDPKKLISYVESIKPLPKRMAKPEPTRSTLFVDLDTNILPPELGLRDAETIRQSFEYAEREFDDQAPRPQQGGYGQPSAGGRVGTPHGAGHPLAGAVKGGSASSGSVPFDETEAN